LGLTFIDITIITVIEVLIATILSGLIKVILFRENKYAFKHILKYGLGGIFIAIIFGQAFASTFTEDRFIINAGRLLVVQFPTYLMLLGLIIGTIVLYRKTRKPLK